MLNKQAGNMYGFVTHTWNVIKGKCKHNCSYCYMKRFPQKELHFDEKELKTDLGEGNIIFVGSSTDMFADNVQDSWIERVLLHCEKYPNNTYLFQTKNPHRFGKFFSLFPKSSIFGTTIESNKHQEEKAPPTYQRWNWMYSYKKQMKRIMITIEPIKDFDLDVLLSWIKQIEPEFVNIGADSNKKKDYSFPEPSKEKVLQLIEELKKFTKVNIKDNLKRLLK